MWEPILPVVIGGLIALLGGALTPVITHILTRRSEQRTLREARLEALLEALYAHRQWLDRKKRIVVFGEEGELVTAPIHKARLLADLHFPTLKSAIVVLDISSDSYQAWMDQAALKRVQGAVGSINEGHVDAYMPYARAYLDAQTAVSDFIEHHRTSQ